MISIDVYTYKLFENMSSSSADTGMVRKVILKSLIGDTIEVEGIQIADAAKAYFDTPFDEDAFIKIEYDDASRPISYPNPNLCHDQNCD